MSVILLDDSLGVTTTTTHVVTVMQAGSAFDRPYFFAEVSGLTGAAGSNSAFNIQLRYLAPGGQAITIATTGAATFATNGITAINLSAPFTVGSTHAVAPMPSQVQYQFSTTGTAIGAKVYVVVPNR